MRLRRKNVPDDGTTEEGGLAETGAGTDVGTGTASTDQALAPEGPIDVDDLDPEATYIDLGSLLVTPVAGLELRLQVDEDSGDVLALMMLGEEGVVEMRAFAASRGGALWDEARGEIAADTTQRGGTVREQEGPFGTELYCEVPVTGPDGAAFIQPSRVLGCTGPRWFLRATIAGRPAQDAEYAGVFEEAIRKVAVRRGTEAMAPGTALALHLPAEARPQTPEETAADLAAGHKLTN